MHFSLSLTTRYIVGIHKLVAVLEYRRSVTFANEMKIHEKCSFASAKYKVLKYTILEFAVLKRESWGYKRVRH